MRKRGDEGRNKLGRWDEGMTGKGVRKQGSEGQVSEGIWDEGVR